MSDCRRSTSARRLFFQTLETRQVFDASSQMLLNPAYRPEVNESASTEQGIFFVRDDARYGTELWASDAAGSDPHLVIDLTTGTEGSQLKSLTAVDGGVYFIRAVSDGRQDLWWTDGSAQNTRMVADNIVDITRSYLDEEQIKPLPNDGTHVYFMKWTLNGGNRSLDTGIWAASNQGRAVQQLTDRSSFVDAVTGTWVPWQIRSFQETTSQFSVFILEATAGDGEQGVFSRRFFGVTDGTPSGTRISNAEVRETSSILDAVPLSDDKLMFVSHSNDMTSVFTIDKEANVELLTESVVSSKIAFQKADALWYFSANGENQRVLFRTDGTAAGTRVVESAGSVHSNPVTLSDGRVLTLAGENFYDRDFQVTDPDTLLTTKLDFILPSETGVIRELFGSVAVGIDKFFYVESKGGNARRLMMADMQERTVSTVLDGAFNEAIGTPILRGDKLYFSYITPTHSDLICFNTVSQVSTTLASIQTESWQGLSIDLVDEDKLIGFINGADSASIFRLRFADDKLSVLSLVDDLVVPKDNYSQFIPWRTPFPFSKIDEQTVAFKIGLVINEQPALEQVMALDTSAKGLTTLIPSTEPQPSVDVSSNVSQALFRAGGKLVYHSDDQVVPHDGLLGDEIWAKKVGEPAQRLIDSRSIDGALSLYPLGVLNDRLYFLSVGLAKSLSQNVRSRVANVCTC